MTDENKQVESNLKTLQDNFNQLEKRFNKLYEDIISKLNESSDCIKLARTSIKGKVILDVGGEKYATSVDTLTRVEDTFFTDLFSKQWQLERDPEDKSIFIDRNGKIFTYILEYLRTDIVPNNVWKDETILHSLLIESQYFRLHALTDMLAGFSNGTLLKLEHKKKLNEFYGKIDQQWELIYKASRDGFDVDAFHTRCNNKGPTMTIIQSDNNYLFGGYTSIPWTSDNSYKNDTTAFLFTLTNPHNIPPTKYLINPGIGTYAVFHHPSYGHTFGYGHDIHLANASNSHNASFSGFPSSYTDTTGQGNATFTGARNFTTSDIEVFKLA